MDNEVAPPRRPLFGAAAAGAGPGRPKGSSNRATNEVRAAARAIVEDEEYRRLLLVRLKVGEAPHMETLLWHYAYGKPKETVEVRDKTDLLGDDITLERIQEKLGRNQAMLRLIQQARSETASGDDDAEGAKASSIH